MAHPLLHGAQWLPTVCQIKSKLPSQASRYPEGPSLNKPWAQPRGLLTPSPQQIWASRCSPCPFPLPQTVQTMATPLALDEDVLTSWWDWHKWRKMSPGRVRKGVRLQDGVRGEPTSVSPSIFCLPHLSPWPSPAIAQSCGHCRMPCLFAKRVEVALKEGNMPKTDRGQGEWAEEKGGASTLPGPRG